MHTNGNVSSQAQQLIDRFWEKVRVSDKDECWEWTAGKDRDGYGKFTDKRNLLGVGRHPRAHRVAYALKNGGIGRDDIACHSCDNPSCCNPDHIWAGTITDNNRDMIRKGRRIKASGARARAVILTECQVRDILKTYQPRHPEYGGTPLAKKYGVHKATISAIVKRKNWKHI